MKILCVICHDLLIPSEDIFFTRCGHVFHHRCLLQWLERSKTCPQCRDEATADRIHKAHFTVSNTETAPDNVDNSTLQGRIDSLQFQILLNERNIKHYTSKNAILEKQNAGLRQEVRKVESEISQKNSAIYALKEQINYFKEKYREYDILKEKLSQKEKEVEQFQNMYKTLHTTSTLEDVKKIVGKTTDRPDTLVNYISVMKKIISKKTKKIENLQNELTRHQKYLDEESSNSLKFEVHLTFCENLSLQQRINELEKLLETSSDQNYVTKSNSRRNSNENSLIKASTVNCYTQQINTKQETADQNDPSILEAEVDIITDANQENSNFTFDKCPTVTKKAKLHLQSSNSESDNSS